MATKKVTDDQIEAALRSQGGVKAFAAEKLGIARQTIQDRVAGSPRLQAVIREVTERVLDLAEGIVVDALNEKDRAMARWLLELKGKSRGYARKTEIDFDWDQIDAYFAALGGDPERLKAIRAQLAPADTGISASPEEPETLP